MIEVSMGNFDRSKIIAVIIIVSSLAWLLGFAFGAIATVPNEVETAAKIKDMHISTQKAIEDSEQFAKQLKQFPKMVETKQEKKSTNSFASSSTDYSKFYDPSRYLPYMANEISMHYTRKAAIEALAEQFEQSTSWVELHMGNTNNLEEIHKNLVKAWLLTR
jgi:hypothetical protein